jgi:hypothetical protein
VPAGPPDPGELVESGPPPPGRRLLVVLGLLVLAGAGLLWFQDRAADRALRDRVVLETTLVISSSSMSPPGGSVHYFVLVRNAGPLPVSVTGVAASAGGLRLRMRDDRERRIPAGSRVEIPLSVRLTCPGRADATPMDLPATVGVRREDGGSTTRRVRLRPAGLALDVARTLCGVRPDLRDRELSGPVLDPLVAEGGNGP